MVMRRCKYLWVLGMLLFAGHPAWAAQLWTVQAVNVNGGVVCDAFATGAAGRAPYEFRFRRSKTSLLLIISYAGPAIRAAAQATILQDGVPLGTLPASFPGFGARPAVVISLRPDTVDFLDLEKRRSLTVVVGAERFDMGLLASDGMGRGMSACMAYLQGL